MPETPTATGVNTRSVLVERHDVHATGSTAADFVIDRWISKTVPQSWQR